MRRHHPHVPPPAEGPYKKYSVLGFPIRDQIKNCSSLSHFSSQSSSGSLISVDKIVNPFKNPLPFSHSATLSTSQFFYSPESTLSPKPIAASPSISPCSSVGMLSPERSHIALTNEDAQFTISVAGKQSSVSDTTNTQFYKSCTTTTQSFKSSTTSTESYESCSIFKPLDITSKDSETSE